MTDLEQYTPGPANMAQIRKERLQNGEEKWTLVLVKDLRHPPEKSGRRLPTRRSCASGLLSTLPGT